MDGSKGLSMHLKAGPLLQSLAPHGPSLFLPPSNSEKESGPDSEFQFQVLY